MKISLITTTNNRYAEMKKLFDSLLESSYKNFELIVVDQSETKVIENLCEGYKTSFAIKYIKAEHMALSKARNIGLKQISGDIVSFPDDDCWFNSECLTGVKEAFENNAMDGICIAVFDPINNVAYSSVASKKPIVKVNSFNAFKYTTSVGIFVRSDFVVEFDENLGIGSTWYGGEDIDYVLNQLHQGRKIYFYNDIKVYHLYSTSEINLDKEFKYCVGYGAVIKKAVKKYGYNFTGKMKYLTVYGKFFLKRGLTKNKKFYTVRMEGMKKGYKEFRP